MAYDEGLAERIREALQNVRGIGEKRMFGGLCFTLSGHMMVGIVKGCLMVRVGAKAEVAAMARPGARPMDFTGKPMKGYLFVDPIGIAEDRELEGWIRLATEFVKTLPVKDASTPARTSKSAKAKPAQRSTADMVVVENPNVPGYTQTVNATMYAEMRRAMLALLPTKAPGMTQTEMRGAIVERLSPILYPGGAKADWWSKLVQLDLEAKGLVVREVGKPLRWHKARS